MDHRHRFLAAWLAPLCGATLLSHVSSGRLRALGVSGVKRSHVLPEVPTVAESGLPGYESMQ